MSFGVSEYVLPAVSSAAISLRGRLCTNVFYDAAVGGGG